jgi:hypothetical protein
MYTGDIRAMRQEISQFENHGIKNNIKPKGDFNFRVDTEINSPMWYPVD